MRINHIIAVAAVIFLSAAASAGNPLKEQLSTPEKCRSVFGNPKADSVLRRAAFRILLESRHADTVLKFGPARWFRFVVLT